LSCTVLLGRDWEIISQGEALVDWLNFMEFFMKARHLALDGVERVGRVR
jgi:hypothetical protein